jgi:hypothetical protein
MPPRPLAPIETELREIAKRRFPVFVRDTRDDPQRWLKKLPGLLALPAVRLRARGATEPELLLRALAAELGDVLGEIAVGNVDGPTAPRLQVDRWKELARELFGLKGATAQNISSARSLLDPLARNIRDPSPAGAWRSEEPLLYALVLEQLHDRGEPAEDDIGLVDWMSVLHNMADLSHIPHAEWVTMKTAAFHEVYEHLVTFSASIIDLLDEAEDRQAPDWREHALTVLHHRSKVLDCEIEIARKYHTTLAKVGFTSERHGYALNAWALADAEFTVTFRQAWCMQGAINQRDGNANYWSFISALEQSEEGLAVVQRWLEFLRSCSCGATSCPTCPVHRMLQRTGWAMTLLERDAPLADVKWVQQAIDEAKIEARVGAVSSEDAAHWPKDTRTMLADKRTWCSPLTR